jgi:hypothetical protein
MKGRFLPEIIHKIKNVFLHKKVLVELFIIDLNPYSKKLIEVN